MGFVYHKSADKKFKKTKFDTKNTTNKRKQYRFSSICDRVFFLAVIYLENKGDFRIPKQLIRNVNYFRKIVNIKWKIVQKHCARQTHDSNSYTSVFMVCHIECARFYFPTNVLNERTFVGG